MDLKPTMAVHPTHNEISHPYIHVHAILYMHAHEHEQSYYIVTTLEERKRRKKEKQTLTIYNSLKGLEKYIYVYTLPASAA